VTAFQNSWIFFAIASAVFAALTAVLSKLGVEGVHSNIATMVRTFVVLCFASILVFTRFNLAQAFDFPRRTFLFLFLSGLATGASWLCYNRALQLGPVAKVAPIDKLSVVFVIVLSTLFLGEEVGVKTVVGGLLIAAGAVVLAI
jgi:bacterial/archaeal transporter family protein